MSEITDDLIVEELGRAWRIVSESLAGEDARLIEGTIPTREDVRNALLQVDSKLPAVERVRMAISTAMMPTFFEASGAPLAQENDPKTQ